ncbi:MAG: hypothetical protein CL844_02850 [Crocinitomicaceae bacterium]|nr:hypothetical protein [Crocinitomicaceae bacterium]
MLKFLMILLPFSVFSQTGGENSFALLNLTYNARSAGLGGNFISVFDKDINMGISNPSLCNTKMNKQISFNSGILSGNINYGALGYGYNIKNIGTLVSYIKYVNYGKLIRTDINGVSDGTFSPFEMIIGTSFGKELNPRISIGGSVNFLYSQLEIYNSFGASIDFSGTYHNNDKNMLITILAKNIGYQFDPFVSGNRFPLPLEIQAAVSYKVKYAPFRFTLLGHNLNKWDISYNDPNIQPTIDQLTGDTIPIPKISFFEKLGRHFSYQLEVFVSKNIDLRIGFDYHRRKELALESRPGLSGFSFGLGLNFDKFSLDYGFMIYSRSGFNNLITLSTQLDKWRK